MFLCAYVAAGGACPDLVGVPAIFGVGFCSAGILPALECGGLPPLISGRGLPRPFVIPSPDIFWRDEGSAFSLGVGSTTPEA